MKELEAIANESADVVVQNIVFVGYGLRAGIGFDRASYPCILVPA